jgi:hypothetical protein
MAGSLEFIKSASGTSVTSLDISDCFSADYDVYQINLVQFDRGTAGGAGIRLLDSVGTVITANEYDWAYMNMRSYSTFANTAATSDSYIAGLAYSQTTSLDTTTGAVWNIFNPYDSSSYTFTKGQSSVMVDGYGVVSYKAIGVHKSAEQITGFQIYTNAVSFNATVKVYGLASN